MNYDEINRYLGQELTPEIIIEEIEEADQFCAINQKVAIPILGRNTCFLGNENLPIHNCKDEYMGMLCFLKNEEKELVELTEWEFIAYFIDADSLVEEHKFKYDYIVLDKDKLSEYMENYYVTAPLWGGFYHIDALPEPFKKKATKIVAVKNLQYPTQIHYETSIQAINEQYAQGRFLEQYHLLELLFDYDLVTKIKKLDENIEGIGALLSSYTSNELDRLKAIITEKSIDVDAIAICLKKAFVYEDKSKMIFYTHKKKGNPLEKEDDFNRFCLEGEFSIVNYRTIKNGKGNPADYSKFILELAAFMIYRIRSSIVHKKIGEYIMKQDDEEFVAEFAEPLINEIIKQAFQETTA